MIEVCDFIDFLDLIRELVELIESINICEEVCASILFRSRVVDFKVFLSARLASASAYISPFVRSSDF